MYLPDLNFSKYMRKRCNPCFFVICLILTAIFACNTPEKPKPVEIVRKPEDLNKKVNKNIASIVAYVAENKGVLNDSITFSQPGFLQKWYAGTESTRTWSIQKQWAPVADSLIEFIKQRDLWIISCRLSFCAIKGYSSCFKDRHHCHERCCVMGAG